MQRWGSKVLHASRSKATNNSSCYKVTVEVTRQAVRTQSTSSNAFAQNLVGKEVPHTRSAAAAKSPPSASRPRAQMPPAVGNDVDPYTMLAPEISHLRTTLINLLGSSHPSLTSIASYYFRHPSKQLRPLLVLLFARATNGLCGRWDAKLYESMAEGADLDRPLTRPEVLNDWNPNMPDHSSSFQSVFELLPPPPRAQTPRYSRPSTTSVTPGLVSPPLILPTQTRLAQLVEMIHVASLLHDDVIDASPLRRGAPSAPAAFGNKLSVLAGDFLLGRASAALSRLGETEVVELISSVIANLVEGEVLQMRDVIGAELGLSRKDMGETASMGRGGEATGKGRVHQEMWNVYLQKTYMKTASLMAKGTRAAVVLGGSAEGEIWKEVAYAYGRNLGIAFQLVDDILDYEAGENTLGKPGGADLRLGLATGPALYAWEEHAELGPLIERKFERDGDVELARDFVRRSSGVERTRDLARAHADKAREVLQLLPASDSRRALEILTERVVKRTW